MIRKRPDRSVWAERSLHRTIKDFDGVDGEDRRDGALFSTRRQFSVPPRLRVNHPFEEADGGTSPRPLSSLRTLRADLLKIGRKLNVLP
jgi:hypothetical protein